MILTLASKNVKSLFLVFALMLGSDRVRGQGLELEVRGEPKNRYPDLTIIREEHIEYWIVDPQTQTILILELVGDSYINFGEFKGDDLLRSPTFGQLKLRIVDIREKIGIQGGKSL